MKSELTASRSIWATKTSTSFRENCEPWATTSPFTTMQQHPSATDKLKYIECTSAWHISSVWTNSRLEINLKRSKFAFNYSYPGKPEVTSDDSCLILEQMKKGQNNCFTIISLLNIGLSRHYNPSKLGRDNIAYVINEELHFEVNQDNITEDAAKLSKIREIDDTTAVDVSIE